MNTTTSRMQMSPDAERIELGGANPVVEHMTIPAFVNTIRHPWTVDEINRFGRKVGASAEAMQLAYMTVEHHLLGYLRVFPVPLLRRIYELMAPAYRWPALPVSHEPRSAVDDLLAKHLQTLSESTEDDRVRGSIADVLKYLDRRAGE